MGDARRVVGSETGGTVVSGRAGSHEMIGRDVMNWRARFVATIGCGVMHQHHPDKQSAHDQDAQQAPWHATSQPHSGTAYLQRLLLVGAPGQRRLGMERVGRLS